MAGPRDGLAEGDRDRAVAHGRCRHPCRGDEPEEVARDCAAIDVGRASSSESRSFMAMWSASCSKFVR